MIDWLARRLRLSREGLFWLALCLAMLATGLFKSINLITLLACVLLAAVFCNWVLVRRQIGRLKAIRELPDLVNVGDSIRWRIHVRPLDGRTRVGIRVDDHGSEGPLHWFVDRLPADGIVVDAASRTGDPDIYAIGDCAMHAHHGFLRRKIRLESVPNALEQARGAAAAIMARPIPAANPPWFWSDQYDLKLQMVGVSDGYEELAIRGSMEARALVGNRVSVERALREGELNPQLEYVRVVREQAPEIRANGPVSVLNRMERE